VAAEAVRLHELAARARCSYGRFYPARPHIAPEREVPHNLENLTFVGRERSARQWDLPALAAWPNVWAKLSGLFTEA